jgi:glycerophosphoryl diester phosphodiesterase
MIELGVQLTADGAVVVLHDETLHRVWGVPRAVVEMTLDEVREVSHGEHGIPTLAEVFEAVPLPVMLDYKEESGAVEPALAEVRRAGAVERTIWAGHNLDGHALLRRLEPDARIALSWSHATPPSERLLRDLGVEWFNPSWDVLEPELVEAMHRLGFGVSTWTVDDEATMRRVLDLGVDAVITNRIGALVPLLEEVSC